MMIKEGNRDADDRESIFIVLSPSSLQSIFKVLGKTVALIHQTIRLCLLHCQTPYYQSNLCWSRKQRSDSHLLNVSVLISNTISTAHGRLLELHNDKDYLHAL